MRHRPKPTGDLNMVQGWTVGVDDRQERRGQPQARQYTRRDATGHVWTAGNQ